MSSKSLEKEVDSIVTSFTSTINKLNASAEKATTEASVKRNEIESLTKEVNALDAISAKAKSIANKINSLLN